MAFFQRISASYCGVRAFKPEIIIIIVIKKWKNSWAIFVKLGSVSEGHCAISSALVGPGTCRVFTYERARCPVWH